MKNENEVVESFVSGCKSSRLVLKELREYGFQELLGWIGDCFLCCAVLRSKLGTFAKLCLIVRLINSMNYHDRKFEKIYEEKTRKINGKETIGFTMKNKIGFQY